MEARIGDCGLGFRSPSHQLSLAIGLSENFFAKLNFFFPERNLFLSYTIGSTRDVADVGWSWST